jgi:hypothetical protein
MEVVVIDSQVWYELNQRLAGIEQQLLNLNKTTMKTPEQTLDWLPLQQVFELLNINRHKWKRSYSKLWKTRKYKRETWIYKPDLDKWLMQHAIN